jgi:hypothetical protein
MTDKNERKFSEEELNQRDYFDGIDDEKARERARERDRVIRLLASADFAGDLEQHGITIAEQIEGITRSLRTGDPIDPYLIHMAIDAAAELAEIQAEHLAEAAAVWLHALETTGKAPTTD